jgi:hypothetical protein
VKIDVWEIQPTNTNLIYSTSWRNNKFVITYGRDDKKRANDLGLKFVANVSVKKGDESPTNNKLKYDREWLNDVCKNKLLEELTGIKLWHKDKEEQLIQEILLSQED